MAKNRYVDTKYWKDGYVQGLDPIEKLLFLYFLTNPMTDICGIYEIPIKEIAHDTGIDADTIMNIMSRFETAEKIKYDNGWVAIKNFVKHQSGKGNVLIGIEKGQKLAPPSLLQWQTDPLQDPSRPFETLPLSEHELEHEHEPNDVSCETPSSNSPSKAIPKAKPRRKTTTTPNSILARLAIDVLGASQQRIKKIQGQWKTAIKQCEPWMLKSNVFLCKLATNVFEYKTSYRDKRTPLYVIEYGFPMRDFPKVIGETIGEFSVWRSYQGGTYWDYKTQTIMKHTESLKSVSPQEYCEKVDKL